MRPRTLISDSTAKAPARRHYRRNRIGEIGIISRVRLRVRAPFSSVAAWDAQLTVIRYASMAISLKRRLISNLDELNDLEKRVTGSAAATAERLSQQLLGAKDLSALASIKFDQTGCDPLDIKRPLNFVEQLNQSFTYLASIEGVRWLLEHHPANAPFHLNLGTVSGPDIVSADGEIVAETFAATHPDSNDKLRKDIAKVRLLPAKHRYVFYLSRSAVSAAPDDVTVIRLDHICLH